MLRSAIALMALCVLLPGIGAQEKRACESSATFILSKDKPTIYVTFHGLDRRKSPSARLAMGPPTAGQATAERKDRESSQPQVVWLRLHNNTRWAIAFPTESLYVGPTITPIRLCDGRSVLGLRTDVEVNARYELERVAEPKPAQEGGRQPVVAPALNRSDMFSASWLPPGGSVIFGVLREHLTGTQAVYLPYNYEWEYGERTFGPNEPSHRVYFRLADLPKAGKTALKNQ